MKEPFESGPSPPGQQKANARATVPALMEDTIPLPAPLRLRSQSCLEGLYSKKHLSIREIARRADVSRAGVLEALDRFGIPRNRDGRRRTGHLPFGFGYISHKLVKNGAEQAVLRLMRQYRAGGCLCERSCAISTRGSFRPSRMASGKPTP